VEIEVGKERWSGLANAIFDEHGRCHMALDGPLGQPVVVLRGARGQVELDVVAERYRLRAAEADGVLHEASGGLVDLAGLIGLGLGRFSSEELEVATGPTHVAAGSEAGAVRGVLVFDREGALPSRLTGMDRWGATLLEGSWSGWREHEGFMLPGSWDLRLGSSARLSAEVEGWEILSEAPRGAFRAPLPSGWDEGPIEPVALALLMDAWGGGADRGAGR